jgi:hypothetical protein
MRWQRNSAPYGQESLRQEVAEETSSPYHPGNTHKEKHTDVHTQS